MLLEKNFNISKSNRPLKEFLEGVYEFKEGKLTIEEWATALDLKMSQIDSANTPIGVLARFSPTAPRRSGRTSSSSFAE